MGLTHGTVPSSEKSLQSLPQLSPLETKGEATQAAAKPKLLKPSALTIVSFVNLCPLMIGRGRHLPSSENVRLRLYPEPHGEEATVYLQGLNDA